MAPARRGSTSTPSSITGQEQKYVFRYVTRSPTFTFWPEMMSLSMTKSHTFTFWPKIMSLSMTKSLIVRAVSKYRGFSQQLIGKSGEMPQNSTSCVVFSAFLDTALWWMSSSRKKRPFLLRRLPFSCIFPVFSWFWTILAKNIRDSLARINKSLIRFWMWVNVGKRNGWILEQIWSKSIKIALLDT